MIPSLSFRALRAVIVVLPALVVLSGCGSPVGQVVAAEGDAAPEVHVVAAKAGGEAGELRLPARAVAGQSARLFARVTGFVSERNVDLGDAVEAGQVLAVISSPEVDQAVREAEADVAQAKADEQLARANDERANALVSTGAISKELAQERKATSAAASATRAAAEARLASARDRQRFATIRAPFAGIIASRAIERGDRVVGDQAAASPLFELIALDPLRVVIDVPQSAALRVQKGVKADVRFPELAGETLQADVVRSAQSLSEASGSMRVELRLPNPGGRIPSGMLGEVRLAIPHAQAVVLVPISAVAQGAKGAQVVVVDAESKLVYRPVIPGRNLGGEIEILEGLAANESIVSSPNALLQPGMRVVVRKQEQKKS